MPSNNFEGIIFDSLIDVQAFQALIDIALGYPREGNDIGSGKHAPDEITDTLHISTYVSHPTLPSTWAFIVWDGIYDVVPDGYEVVTLDRDEWFPQNFM